MTKEEAKNWLNKLYVEADITDEYGDMVDMQPYSEAVDMAIEALEQEPKTGRWEEVQFRTIPYNRISKAKKCSECGKRKDKYVTWNYCPNCRARMIER